MTIPTIMMDALHIENGDWVKLRVGTGYYALVKTHEKRGVQIKNNKIRFPQAFVHAYRFKPKDRVMLCNADDKIVFQKAR